MCLCVCVCVGGGGGDTKLQIQNSSSTRVYPMRLVTTEIKKSGSFVPTLLKVIDSGT